MNDLISAPSPILILLQTIFFVLFILIMMLLIYVFRKVRLIDKRIKNIETRLYEKHFEN